mgnify:CR=1 FL=1|tara:strand:- start:86 stop:1150 length:1065 start_codon:yes stop_codon:yes gene_type:complete
MKILDLFKQEGAKNITIRKPYVIAEAGVNHEGDMEIAKRLINDAAEGGADAIKFQTYKAETIASKFSPSYWDTSKEPTKSQYLLFKKYDKFWKPEYEKLKVLCDQNNIEFMSTPFDIESANFLNDMMDVFKISSSDIDNMPFINHICNFEKPILLSTGASYISEINEALSWVNKKKVPIALLHCILNYPTENKNAHLSMIRDLQNKFPDIMIGYSDHTLPLNSMEVLQIATLMGAVIIEKHFTHNKKLKGNDHYHSMDKHDLKLFNQKLLNLFSILGNTNKEPIALEEIARNNARRSLVAVCDIPKNTIIRKEHLTWKRPAHGISPKDINKVIGKKSKNTINEDDLIQWDSFIS